MTTKAHTTWPALVVAAVVLTTPAAAAAHPLAATTISVVATDARSLSVTIAGDGDALIARLEALGGAPLSLPRTLRDDAHGIEALFATLAAHVEIRASEAPLALRFAEAHGRRSGATLKYISTPRFHPSAQTLTWRSTLLARVIPDRDTKHRRSPKSSSGFRVRRSSRPVALDGPRAPAGFINGLVMGFTHIVPDGIDHMLFVLGLFLLSRKSSAVLLQVTAFTVAHSITLGLSLYGVVSAPASIVEPMIALSVAYVGVENLMTSRLHPWRVAVVFAFGLLHGMGFAEALAGLRLSPSSFATTLVSFNLGVEAGQLAVIAAAALVLAIVTRLRATANAPTVRLASAAIGVVGAIWTIQRLTGG